MEISGKRKFGVLGFNLITLDIICDQFCQRNCRNYYQAKSNAVLKTLQKTVIHTTLTSIHICTDSTSDRLIGVYIRLIL